MRAREIAEEFPLVQLSDEALSTALSLATHRLPGVVVVDEDGGPVTVLPGSQVLRFLVPGYVQDDPSLARVFDERTADALRRQARRTAGTGPVATTGQANRTAHCGWVGDGHGMRGADGQAPQPAPRRGRSRAGARCDHCGAPARTAPTDGLTRPGRPREIVLVEFVRLLLVFLHLLGMAILVGSFLLQRKAAKDAPLNQGWLHGAALQLVTGLALQLLAPATDAEYNNVKLGIKMLVLLVIGGLSLVYVLRRLSVANWLNPTLGGLVVVNVGLAVFWT